MKWVQMGEVRLGFDWYMLFVAICEMERGRGGWVDGWVGLVRKISAATMYKIRDHCT
jgi:hypothetical protein